MLLERAWDVLGHLYMADSVCTLHSFAAGHCINPLQICHFCTLQFLARLAFCSTRSGIFNALLPLAIRQEGARRHRLREATDTRPAREGLSSSGRWWRRRPEVPHSTHRHVSGAPRAPDSSGSLHVPEHFGLAPRNQLSFMPGSPLPRPCRLWGLFQGKSVVQEQWVRISKSRAIVGAAFKV